MRLIDDYAIPHWIIEEEVNELPNTRKRVGFCDAQEDAELIVVAPKLKDENKCFRKLLEDVRKFLDRIYAEDIISSGDLGEIYKRVEKAAEDD